MVLLHYGAKKTGSNNKEVSGKKATLLKDISFFVDCSMKDRKFFSEGIEISALYEVVGTGLTVFNFVDNMGRNQTFPLKNNEFSYKE